MASAHVSPEERVNRWVGHLRGWAGVGGQIIADHIACRIGLRALPTPLGGGGRFQYKNAWMCVSGI